MGRARVESVEVEGGLAPKSAVAAAGRWEIKGRRVTDRKCSAGLKTWVETLCWKL